MSGQEAHIPNVAEVPVAARGCDYSAELVIEVYDQWSNPHITGPTAWCAWTYRDGGEQVAA